MKSIFVVLSALVTMLLMVLLYYLIKKEYRYKDSLWVTISIGAITIVVYTGYIISTSNVVAVFLHGMYLACIDWLVLCILLFVLRLMGKDYKSTGYFKILICLSCFDTITLFINGFKNFINRYDKDNLLIVVIGVILWKIKKYSIMVVLVVLINSRFLIWEQARVSQNLGMAFT